MIEKQWLESNRYYSELDESKLTSIFYFPLIWNLFEKDCCDNDAAINKHPKEIAKKHTDEVDSELVGGVYSHFLGRYVEGGQTTSLFNNFKFGKNNQDGKVFKDFVIDVLLTPEAGQQKQVLLYIAFRLRNNLYHGIKDVSRLYEQNENFRQINRLLMALIDMQERR